MNSLVNKDFKLIILAGIIFVFIDSIYLSIMTPFYSKLILKIQNKPMEFDIFAALLCYVSLLFGLYYFVLREKKSVSDAILLGLVIYAVFEFTNKAMFKKWNWTSVVIDTLWGGALFGLTTYFVYKIYGIM
jgi:uncharacterized membrane protein